MNRIVKKFTTLFYKILKILYNISKAQYVKGPDLFKKIDEDIWEFRT